MGDEIFVLEDGHLKSHLVNEAPFGEKENSTYSNQLKKEILSLVEN
ncbi:MAG: hypothetical protein ACRC9L_06255 [Brevinema sp.]